MLNNRQGLIKIFNSLTILLFSSLKVSVKFNNIYISKFFVLKNAFLIMFDTLI